MNKKLFIGCFSRDKMRLSIKKEAVVKIKNEYKLLVSLSSFHLTGVLGCNTLDPIWYQIGEPSLNYVHFPKMGWKELTNRLFSQNIKLNTQICHFVTFYFCVCSPIHLQDEGVGGGEEGDQQVEAAKEEEELWGHSGVLGITVTLAVMVPGLGLCNC